MSKVVVISGATKGLGWELLQRHVAAGDTVYAWGVTLSPEAEQAIAAHANLHMCSCDISKAEEVARAAAMVRQNTPHIDILYNVAGVHDEADLVPLAGTDLERAARMYDINAVGPMRVTQALLGLLGEGTAVVMVSSEAGSIGACRRTEDYAYCMSKAALNMVMKILSNELFRQGVRCVAVNPGWMRTPMGGARAVASPESVDPGDSADHIVDIALHIKDIPPDQLFMEHTGTLLPW